MKDPDRYLPDPGYDATTTCDACGGECEDPRQRTCDTCHWGPQSGPLHGSGQEEDDE